MQCSAVIVAAGRGTRFGDAKNKILLRLRGRPVLDYSLRAFDSVDAVSEIVVVVHPHDREAVEEVVRGSSLTKRVKFAAGGDRRIDSVLSGVRSTDPRVGWVAVHDAARPLVKPTTIEQALAAAREVGGAVVATAAIDTVKHTSDGKRVDATIPRQEIYLAQTPQIFPRAAFLAALESAAQSGAEFTDDAAVAERAGIPVGVVAGEAENIKITHAADLTRAEKILEGLPRLEDAVLVAGFRVGTGFDIHRMAPGRKCILGGIDIPSERGPLGYSDGDAILHALGDAILAAAGFDDLGTLFPNTDPRYEGIDSRQLLRQCVARVREAGFSIVNASCVVVLERPKIAPHRAAIRASIAPILGVDVSRVNVNGKTAEGLGALGAGDAVAVTCTVLLQCAAR